MIVPVRRTRSDVITVAAIEASERRLSYCGRGVAATTIARLPPELRDSVLNFVDSDGSKDDLKSCALTCRAWRTTSQRFLFRAIYLRHEARCGTTLAIVESSPHLVPHIRYLWVCAVKNRGHLCAADSLVLPVLIPQLRHLRTMGLLIKSDAYAVHTPFLGPLFSPLPSVDCIDLMETGTYERPKKNMLADLLNYFTGLRSLHLTIDARCDIDSPDATSTTKPPTFSLRSLHLGSCPDLWTLEWLLQTPLSLTQLKLTHVTDVECDHLLRILDATGEFLQDLCVDTSLGRYEESVLSVLAHASKVCTGLRRLHIGSFRASRISGASQPDYSYHHPSPSRVLQALSTSRCSLVCLELGVSLEGTTQNKESMLHDWSLVDDQLFRTRMTLKLQQVVIDICYPPLLESKQGRSLLASRIRNAMPLLSDFGVLRIDFFPED